MSELIITTFMGAGLFLWLSLPHDWVNSPVKFGLWFLGLMGSMLIGGIFGGLAALFNEWINGR